MIAIPRHRTVSDVMTRKVHVASPTTPFKVLVRLIEDNRVSGIPIVDAQGTPVGVVSEADLLFKERRKELTDELDMLHPRKHRRELGKARGVLAAEIMTSPPVIVGWNTPLTEAARLMQQRNVRRLIVVDERGKIAGVVSRSDLLQVFLRTDEELREEIATKLIPAILLWPPSTLSVDVTWNVVTLSGEVDRRSDMEILTRLAGEVDGVVDVVNRLTYRWDERSEEAR